MNNIASATQLRKRSTAAPWHLRKRSSTTAQQQHYSSITAAYATTKR